MAAAEAALCELFVGCGLGGGCREEGEEGERLDLHLGFLYCIVLYCYWLLLLLLLLCCY